MKSILPKKYSLILVSTLLLLSPCPVLSGDWIYAVKPGDSIWTIAENYLSNVSYWKRLQALNNVQDPLHIPPGTKLRIPVNWLAKFPVVARIHSINGAVQITEEDNDKARFLKVGDYLFIGDVIHTGADATAVIEFVDGSNLLIQPQSQLIMANLGIYSQTDVTSTLLKLTKGRIETHVRPKKDAASRFEIKTPAGITSVRGTDYRVSAEPAVAESRTEVIEGAVGVTSRGKTRLIPQGFGTVSSLDSPPKAPIELLPAPDMASVPELFERLPLYLNLSEKTGINRYRIQLSKNPDFDHVLFDKLFEGNKIRISELPDGHYHLRVRGVDQQGLEGKNGLHAFTVNARPEPPLLLEPKPDSGVPQEQPQFSWAKLQSVQHYHIQIAEDALFKKIIIDNTNLVDVSYAADKKLTLGQYYWRVASINTDEGQGPFSDAQVFRRVMPAPNAEEPEVSDTSIMMRWRAGLPGQKYQFQLATESSFAPPLIDKRIEKAELEIDRPAGGKYFIRIRTIEPDGFIGPYNEPQMIEIPDQFNYWWLMALPLLGLIAL